MIYIDVKLILLKLFLLLPCVSLVLHVVSRVYIGSQGSHVCFTHQLFCILPYSNVPRCRLSLYQSSFLPSVINLSNSLDNETRNTRTSDTFKINLQRKVVLSKIPGNFLVCDRRSNNLYTSLRRNYSSLKYYLF